MQIFFSMHCLTYNGTIVDEMTARLSINSKLETNENLSIANGYVNQVIILKQN
jgi:hypothetical protein